MHPALLGDWLPLVKTAGLPHVPAVEVARFPSLLDAVGVVLDEEEASPETAAAFDALAAARKAATEAGDMLRWDICSSEDLKHRMARGKHEWDPQCARLTFDDCRLVDLVMMEGLREVRVWRRPWVAAVIDAGYPVEFRVFVADGKVLGVSSYYPQRPLTVADGQELAEQAGKLAERLAREPGAPPSFSADFLLAVGPPRELLWLECAPLAGSHPCCFAPGSIAGIALAPQDGALTE